MLSSHGVAPEVTKSSLPMAAVFPIGNLSRFLRPAQTFAEPAKAIAEQVTLHRVLILEKDAALARLLASGLVSDQVMVDIAHDVHEAAQRIENRSYGVVVLGHDTADAATGNLLRTIRAKHSTTGVLVLTRKGRPQEMVDMLDQGADDCLAKPFSLIELMARVRAMQRRSTGTSVPIVPVLNGLVLNRTEYRVERCGRKIVLTPREFALLEFLVDNPGKVLSRSTLMQAVWAMEGDANTNIVDVYMKYLRDKLDADGEESLIRTVRGVGYLLNN